MDDAGDLLTRHKLTVDEVNTIRAGESVASIAIPELTVSVDALLG